MTTSNTKMPFFMIKPDDGELGFIETLQDLGVEINSSTSLNEIQSKLTEIYELANNIYKQRDQINISENTPQWLKDYNAYQIYDDEDINNPPSSIKHSLEEVEKKFQLISALTDNATSFKNLYNFYQDCQTNSQQELFNSTWRNYFLVQENIHHTVHAEQEFQITKKGSHVQHHLRNIDKTGLDLCIIDNKITVMNLKEKESLSAEQLSALHKITSKLDITNLSPLKGITAYNAEGKVVDLSNELQKPKSSNIVPKATYIPNTPKKNKFTASPDSNHQDDKTDLDSKYQDDGTDFNSYDFIKRRTIQEDTRENRKNFRNSALNKLNEPYKANFIKTTVDWGSYTVRVYSSKDDYLEDGKIDSKKGSKKQTKLFAFTIKNGNPPKASIFLGKKAELKAGDVAPILKDFAARGYDTFIMPDASILGKSVFKAFLEASVTTGVVPQLKQSDDDKVGMALNSGDIGDLLKAWEEKKTNQPPEKRIQMSLRLSEQLAGYAKTEDGRKEEIASKAQKLLMEARFEKFSNIYLADIQAFANGKNDKGDKNIDTKVDLMAYKYALGQITKNISQGKLPVIENDTIKTNNKHIVFQTFDPMDRSKQNTDDIQKALKAYMKIATKQVEKDLITVYNKLNESQENERITNLRKRVFSEVEKKYDINYNQIINDIATNGADKNAIQVNIFPQPIKDVNVDNDGKDIFQQTTKGVDSRENNTTPKKQLYAPPRPNTNTR